MSLFGYFLSELVNAGIGKDPFMLYITSPESHIYKWEGFLAKGSSICTNFWKPFL